MATLGKGAKRTTGIGNGVCQSGDHSFNTAEGGGFGFACGLYIGQLPAPFGNGLAEKCSEAFQLLQHPVLDIFGEWLIRIGINLMRARMYQRDRDALLTKHAGHRYCRPHRSVAG